MRSSSKSSSYCYFVMLLIWVSKFFFSMAMSAIFTISIVFKVCSDSKSSSVLFYISSAAIYLSCYLMKFSLISIPPPTYLSKLTKATLFWCIRLSMHTKSDSVRCNLFINVCLVFRKHWLIFFWQMLRHDMTFSLFISRKCHDTTRHLHFPPHPTTAPPAAERWIPQNHFRGPDHWRLHCRGEPHSASMAFVVAQH